jgi:hypothetical protein
MLDSRVSLQFYVCSIRSLSALKDDAETSTAFLLLAEASLHYTVLHIKGSANRRH